MKAFCTIVTSDYLPYALALRESVIKFSEDVKFVVLVTDKSNSWALDMAGRYTDLLLLYADDLCKEAVGREIYDKYYDSYIDAFRWSMKPVLLRCLLQRHGFEKVIYVDCDIHFYSDYNFLFAELDSYNVLLTPHWRASDGNVDRFNFMQLYVFGLYNAGFIAVNAKAVGAMEWWSRANLFICEIDPCKGQYVDQTHLNLLPVYFSGVKSLEQRGCNVADWNIVECKRYVKGDQVVINHDQPLVFVHFTRSTIFAIQEGRDPLLRPHLEKYFDTLRSFGVQLEQIVHHEREANRRKLSLTRKSTVLFKLKVLFRKGLAKLGLLGIIWSN